MTECAYCAPDETCAVCLGVTAAGNPIITPEEFTRRVHAGTKMAEAAVTSHLADAYAAALRSVAGDASRRFRRQATSLTAAFDPSKHPHEPGGTPIGGRWASTVMYHVAPVSQRESISSEGLQDKLTNQGVFVWATKQDAQKYRDQVGGDVWEVDPSGLSLEADPWWDVAGRRAMWGAPGQSFVVKTGGIPQKNVRLNNEALTAAGREYADEVPDPKFVAPPPEELVPKAKLAAEIDKRTREIRAQVVAVTVGGILTEAGIDFTVGGLFARRILDDVGARLRDADLSTRDAIRTVIDRAQNEGWTVPETAGAIKTHINDLSDSTATQLARTDLIGTSNASAIAAARMVFAGQSVTKRWLATEDERTRETHAEADGQSVPLDGRFVVGDSRLDFPGDPSGPDAEVCNCRCTLLFEEEGDVTAAVWQSLVAAFDPALHPHRPGGSPAGGEWAPKGTSWTGPPISPDPGYVHKVENRWDIRSGNKIDEMAARHGMTVGQYQDAVEVRAREYLESAYPAIRVPVTLLDEVAADGRMKSQFETQTSGGLLSNHTRDIAEKEMFGYPSDLAVEQRPIYGYMHVPGKNPGRVEAYGDAELELKHSVRSRTTFTDGDSLNEATVPSAVNSPSYLSTNAPRVWKNEALDTDPLKTGPRTGAYTEAQIHGGVTLDDVAAVHLREYWGQQPLEMNVGGSDLARAVGVFKEHGIPVYYDLGATMKVIAERGGTLLISDDGETGYVRDGDGEIIGPLLVQAVLARGYWRPAEGDISITAAFDSGKHPRNPATGPDGKESPGDGGKFKAKESETLDLKPVLEPASQGGRKMTEAQVNKRAQQVSDDLAEFYGAEGRAEVRYEPEATAEWDTDARSLITKIDQKPEIWYGANIMEDARDPDFGVAEYRKIAHESVHANVSGQKNTSGFYHDFEEGGSEVLSINYWGERGQPFDARDAVRVDGRWTSPGTESLAHSVVYREQTADVVRRAASRVGWDQSKVVDEVHRMVAGNSNTRLDFRDNSDPEFTPPAGVDDDAVGLMKWLLGGARTAAGFGPTNIQTIVIVKE